MMMKILYKSIKNRKGFTLIELVIVMPLIAIVLLVGYNIFFLTTASFSRVSEDFDVAEELRIFQINIQKEANQAKKAEEKIDVLYRPNAQELHIYTDVNNDDIPDIVRYKLEDKKIKRAVKFKKTSSVVYPYEYQASFTNEKVVLNQVVNTDIFGEVSEVKAPISGQETKDYRRKALMKLEIKKTKTSNTMKVETYLVSKSRTEAE